MKEPVKGWYHIVSWKTLDDDFELIALKTKCGKFKKDFDGKQKYKIKNKRYEYDLNKLFSGEGVKYLRTLYYSTLYRKSYFKAKYSYNLRNKETAHYNKTEKLACPRTNYMEVSASYVQLSTETTHCQSTLSKHLKRSVKYDLFRIIPQFEVKHFENLDEMRNFIYSCGDNMESHWLPKRGRFKGDGTFTYSAVKFYPNLICPMG